MSQNERDRTRRDELQELIRDAVRQGIRDEIFFTKLDGPVIPPCDSDAERKVLCALLAGVIKKPYGGLESHHFYSDAHKEIYARCHLPVDQIRQAITGEFHVIDAFYDALNEPCGPYVPGELLEAAARIKELSDQRELIQMFRDLEFEMRYGKIQVCDAEHVLQEHLLRHVDGQM